MARGVYFSGDLATLNDAMASEERNRIAARAANQGFLGGLVRESTARRGQDTQERMSNRNLDVESQLGNRRADVSERLGTEQSAIARQQSQNALQQAILLNQRELQRIGVDAERVRVLEQQGVAGMDLEKQKLAQEAQLAKQREDSLLKVALIQAYSQQGRMDPRTSQAALEANLGIAETNQQAKSAADMANMSARGKEWGIFGDPEEGDFLAALKELAPEQQGLVELGSVGGKRAFIPRQMAPIQAPQAGMDLAAMLRLITGTNGAPSVATPPIVPPSTNDPLSLIRIIPAPQPRSQTNSAASIFRGRMQP